MSDFVHLHNHTHYSLQDAACTVEGLVTAAAHHGMKSVALTDHGVLYGVPELLKYSAKKGIKPIVGMEAYIVLDGSRFEKGGLKEAGMKRKKPYHHLILLAKNLTGYHNLIKLSTRAFIDGYYYRPRIDFDLLQQHHEGLICTTACIGGIVSSFLVNDDYAKAREVSVQFKDLFGDDFYLEIQDHGQEADKPVLEYVPKLSRELGIKMVATNDCHYIKHEDAQPHNVLLHLSGNSSDYNKDVLRYGTDQLYFKSQEEMIDLFKGYKGAIESTLEIEEKIDLTIKMGAYHFPVFPIPEESGCKTLDEYMEQLAWKGFNKLYEGQITQELRERMEFELMTIKNMGFSGYFLIVQDFINSSKDMGIPVGPGRGSAAGSMVAYALGITKIEPVEYGLLFERFLNPARKSMPDIDVDFSDERRGEVIDYVKKKYGEESVCQIITFNRLSSKQVLRDVARVLQIPIPKVNSITKYIPAKFGKVYSIDEAIAEVPELKWVKDSKEPEILELLKYARILEGMNRNAGKHAAGVVIAPSEVSDYVPLAIPNADKKDLVTQFNMKELEAFGLIKMDFLGLRTLSIIDDTLKLIRETQVEEDWIADIDKISVKDEEAFEIFCKGQTTGVFQFESGPMREYLKRLKPGSIKDLAAMNALYRPGPMDFIDDFIDRKFGRKKVEYLHPLLEPILGETYGIIVYQEQVIQIANRLAGMSLADADILRRAMGKKDLVEMEKQKKVFIGSAVDNGVAEKVAAEIFDNIVKFANYGFNKSHSVAYSYLAYQTAYLKAHFPVEFMTSNLIHQFDNQSEVGNLLNECRKLKIEILAPDINNPTSQFKIINGKILFGLASIKNVGTLAVESIIASKAALGRDFKSIFDFASNCDLRLVNKRAVEGLVLAGAFDRLHRNRAQLFEAVSDIIDFGQKQKQYISESATGFFADVAEEAALPEPPLPEVKKWSDEESLAKEREVLGFYATSHPLNKYEVEYHSFSDVDLADIGNLENKSIVRVCSVVTSVEKKIDKNGNTMAFFKVDSLSGAAECVMYSKVYDKCGRYVEQESCVLVWAKPESSGDSIKLMVEDVVPIAEVRTKKTKSIKITIDPDKTSIDCPKKLGELFVENPGNTAIFLEYLPTDGGNRRFRSDFRINLGDEMFTKLKKIVGDEGLMLYM